MQILNLQLIVFLVSILTIGSSLASKKASSHRRSQERSQQYSNDPEFDMTTAPAVSSSDHVWSMGVVYQPPKRSPPSSLSSSSLPSLSSILTQTPSLPSSSHLTINVTAILGQSAFLPCAVRNIGTYSLLWLRVSDGDVLAVDNMLITQDSRFSLVKKFSNESNLLIQGVKLTDAGEYVCQINTETVKSKIVNLIIFTPPTFSDFEMGHHGKHSPHHHHNKPAAHQQPSEHVDKSTKTVSVIEGKQLGLECTAIGYPKPTINWYVKRHKSNNLTVFSLNSNKILVSNVMQKQYDYFECEASNRVPPSISRKFKINVLYRPEVTVSPTKIYIPSMPVKVRVNCTVSSSPESSINWIHNYINIKETNQQTLKRLRQALDTNYVQQRTPHGGPVKLRRIGGNRTTHANSGWKRTTRSGRNAPPPSEVVNYNQLFFPTITVKYNIIEHLINETFKLNTLIINVENENDFGVYECFANNSAGSKSVKFHIYGDQSKTGLSTNSSSTKTVLVIPKNINENNLTAKSTLNSRGESGKKYFNQAINMDETELSFKDLETTSNSSSESRHRSTSSSAVFLDSIFGSAAIAGNSASTQHTTYPLLITTTSLLLITTAYTRFLSVITH